MTTHKQLGTLFWMICILGVMGAQAQKSQQGVLSEDGGWCWFSDPRAIYINDQQVLTGWVTSAGSIEAAMLDVSKNTSRKQVLFKNLEKDDHDNPAFLGLENGAYMTFYTKHSKKDMYIHHQDQSGKALFSEAVHLDPNSKEELQKYPLHHVTYANPYQLTTENGRIYCFGRWTGFKPNLMWSDDQGKTFGTSRVFIAEKGFRASNRPYVKYFSDGTSRIHILFTDGHPRNEATNSVYYAYYEKGAFFRADGTQICTMAQIPFTPKQATKVYEADESSGRAWIYDLAVDQEGRIAILYARYPTENQHIYHYARYEGGMWEDVKLCDAGKWFPQTPEGETEREPHYSGGMTINPTDLNEVFVSRQIRGTFEIQKFTYRKRNASWKIKPLTKNSTYDQIRPYVPRNGQAGGPTVLLWMENKRYVHYTDYHSRILYRIF